MGWGRGVSLIMVEYFQFIKRRFCLKTIGVYLDGSIVTILLVQVRGLVSKCKNSTEALYPAIHQGQNVFTVTVDTM